MAEFLQASLVQTYLRDIACSDHCTKVSHNLYWWRALPSICRICNICEARQNKGTSAPREEELVNLLEQTLAWPRVHRPNPCTVHWFPSVTLTPSQGTVKAMFLFFLGKAISWSSCNLHVYSLSSYLLTNPSVSTSRKQLQSQD